MSHSDWVEGEYWEYTWICSHLGSLSKRCDESRVFKSQRPNVSGTVGVPETWSSTDPAPRVNSLEMVDNILISRRVWTVCQSFIESANRAESWRSKEAQCYPVYNPWNKVRLKQEKSSALQLWTLSTGYRSYATVRSPLEGNRPYFRSAPRSLSFCVPPSHSPRWAQETYPSAPSRGSCHK